MPSEQPKINNGGAAFPYVPGYPTAPEVYTGMSLRQWYAGMALSGFCHNEQLVALAEQIKNVAEYTSAREALVDKAFQYADQMIEHEQEGK